MLNNNIGYIICETASSEPTKPTIISEKNGKVEIETILQDMNVKNRNGRYYDEKDLVPAISDPRILELIKTQNFLGECNHPMSKDVSRQSVVDISNASHKILKMWKDGKDIKGVIKGTPTDVGKWFNDFVLDGTEVSFSLRALGSVNNTGRGAEVKNIKIITYDWVVYPSHKRAYMTKVLSESTSFGEDRFERDGNGIFLPVKNKNVVDYIKQESGNIKSVMESFDLLYNNIEIVNGGKQVQLVDKEGSKLMINLETYIQNEIMNYCLR